MVRVRATAEPSTATPTLSTPAARPKAADSIVSSRRSRLRVAPSGVRTAIPRSRPRQRTRKKFARFAAPMSSKHIAAPKRRVWGRDMLEGVSGKLPVFTLPVPLSA